MKKFEKDLVEYLSDFSETGMDFDGDYILNDKMKVAYHLQDILQETYSKNYKCGKCPETRFLIFENGHVLNQYFDGNELKRKYGIPY